MQKVGWSLIAVGCAAPPQPSEGRWSLTQTEVIADSCGFTESGNRRGASVTLVRDGTTGFVLEDEEGRTVLYELDGDVIRGTWSTTTSFTSSSCTVTTKVDEQGVLEEPTAMTLDASSTLVADDADACADVALPLPCTLEDRWELAFEGG